MPGLTMDLQTLRARVRATLTFADQWPDETLGQWLMEAIDAYSLEFPRPSRIDIDLTTGTQAYALPPDLLAVQRVEYPLGQDPREWLAEVDLLSNDFRDEADVYAIGPMAADVTLEATVGPYEIVFAPTVTTGEQARIYYAGHHIIPTADEDLTSVPAAHAEALIAFAEFRGHWQLESNAAYNADGSNVDLSQLGINSRKAWTRYKEITDRLHAKTAAPSGRITWRNRP